MNTLVASLQHPQGNTTTDGVRRRSREMATEGEGWQCKRPLPEAGYLEGTLACGECSGVIQLRGTDGVGNHCTGTAGDG